LENEELKPLCDVYLSYNEKPGIQTIGNTAEDLPPVLGKHLTIGRLAGIDLVSGKVIGSVEERHRSREFIEFLKKLDTHYSPELLQE
jgi:hypothetical protein